ncbi:sodium:proton antiporter [Amylibacter sp. IMCC11727]|uniref:cation:proton antiporter n=1 Tax=Amylibacter sp. IMCC11727 TaxID=3039851 RepID=UPI00244E2DD0|nr:sodium:proton antiporter [Amylibacter sp. IMCC11727]WGI20703.1 sodium:proton antiporter [Amylibacter sp. IMCC11727]
MISVELVLLGVVASIVLWALGAARLSRTLITLPMIFTAVGYGVTYPVGMLADEHALNEVARFVAEVTLIIVLFADASHVRFRDLSKGYGLPLRMLVIGMPLTIILGTLAVYFITPGGSWAVALLTAAILTPTDAALGASVVGSKDVPRKLTQTINVESGLNDGLALPFVLFGATAAGMAARGAGAGDLLNDAVLQVVLGPVAGIVVGGGIAWLMNRAQGANWANDSSEAIVFLASAFAAYLGANVIGGNGFIAAFVAGMTFGNVYKHDLHFIREFMESQGQLVTIMAFLIFGAVLLPAGLAHFSVIPLLIAALFLTLVRMLPIVLSLIGTNTTFAERLFLGWFGPRGLASVLFALIVIDEYDIPFEAELQACVVMTVFVSIILHGMSAAPLAKYFGRKD